MQFFLYNIDSRKCAAAFEQTGTAVKYEREGAHRTL